MSNILTNINPLDREVSHIFQNIKCFYKGSNLIVPLFSGLLNWMLHNKPYLHKRYILKIGKWLIKDWSYYPSLDLRLKIVNILFIEEKDYIFYTNFMDILKELIDSFFDNKYQLVTDFDFHTSVCSLYMFY